MDSSMNDRSFYNRCGPIDFPCGLENIELLSDILQSGADVLLRVTGKSMAPFLPSGATVTLRAAPVKQLCLGDLIMCRHQKNKIILHRLIGVKKKEKGKSPPMLITKGDALDTPDQPVDASAFMARVVRIGCFGDGGIRINGKCRDMGNMAARASNYARALYHCLRSAAIGGYIRFKNRHVVVRRDSNKDWFDRYLPHPFSLDHLADLTWIRNQSLQGIIYRRLKARDITPKGSDFLENAYHGVLFNAVRMQGAIADLESPLAAKNISLLVFKGAALLEHGYPDPGMRPMEDIDILARPKDLCEIEKVLNGLGYRRDAQFSRMFFKNGICIDLHGHLVHADRMAGRKTLFNVDMDLVWQDSLPWRPGFDYIRRPCDADHLILMAHHMIKHSFSKWIWLHDAYMLLKNFDDADWLEFARKTRQYRQERPVGVMLYMAEGVFNIRAPAGLPFAGWVSRLSFLEKAILNIKLRGGDISDLGNLLWLFCIQKYNHRLRFLREAVFGSAAAKFRSSPISRAGAGKHGGLHRGIQWLQRINRNLKILVKGLLVRPSLLLK